MIKKAMCALLVCLALPALAFADVGRDFQTFEAAYAQNIDFLNANTGRHMLPYTAVRDYNADGSMGYRIQMGALDVLIRLEDERINTLEITLTAPEGMAYGDREYNDFSVSGYQSYAVMMAMSEAATPYERYALVESVNQAMSASETCRIGVGDYRLTCTRKGNAVSLLFENELLMTGAPELPEDLDEEAEGDSLAG